MKRLVVGFVVGIFLYGFAQLLGLSGTTVVAIILVSFSAGCIMTLWIEDAVLKEARDHE